MRARVYIAAPYTTGDPIINTRNAMIAWAELWYAGFIPICPHWTMFQHLLTPLDYEMWLEYDREILMTCNAVLRLPGASKGADQEVSLATECGIPVFFNTDALRFRFEQKSREDNPT